MKLTSNIGKFRLLLIFILLIDVCLKGQKPDNLTIERQEDYIRKLYTHEVEIPKELINGKEYAPYYMRSIYKPLLYADRERTAILYSGVRKYDKLTLQYDTYLDEVIFTDTSKMINFMYPQIALNKNIVKGFDLIFNKDTLKFRFLDMSSSRVDKNGFYEIAYMGRRSKYIIRHRSYYFELQGVVNYKYSPLNMIDTGNGFAVVKNNKDLLELLDDRNGTIKEYLRSMKIKLRKADKSQFISILKIYDTLKNSEN